MEMNRMAPLFISLSSLFISNSACAQYGLADGNFEQQGAGVATYCYFPNCPASMWSGTTGLIHTPSVDWGASLAPSPTTAAFVQMTGTLSQTFAATATVQVRLAWLEADRPLYGGETYTVTVNGTQIGALPLPAQVTSSASVPHSA